jgi:hypothetical protein
MAPHRQTSQLTGDDMHQVTPSSSSKIRHLTFADSSY